MILTLRIRHLIHLISTEHLIIRLSLILSIPRRRSTNWSIGRLAWLHLRPSSVNLHATIYAPVFRKHGALGAARVVMASVAPLVVITILIHHHHIIWGLLLPRVRPRRHAHTVAVVLWCLWWFQVLLLSIRKCNRIRAQF